MKEKNMKKKTKPTLKKIHQNALFMVTIGLGLLAIVLLATIMRTQKEIVVQQTEILRQEVQSISAPQMQYVFNNDKQTAKKRTDAVSKEFMAFMQKQADESGCGDVNKNLAPAHFVAKAFNKDETQAVIGYGCGSPSSLAYAQLKNGQWEFLQQSNMTEPITGAPRCDFVNKHTIDRKLAPICVRNMDSKDTSKPLEFVVR